MDIFAHNGVEHATKAEAAGHILSTNLITIGIIVIGVTLAALSTQWLLRKTSKVTINMRDREK